MIAQFRRPPNHIWYVGTMGRQCYGQRHIQGLLLCATSLFCLIPKIIQYLIDRLVGWEEANKAMQTNPIYKLPSREHQTCTNTISQPLEPKSPGKAHSLWTPINGISALLGTQPAEMRGNIPYDQIGYIACPLHYCCSRVLHLNSWALLSLVGAMPPYTYSSSLLVKYCGHLISPNNVRPFSSQWI